MTVSSSTNRVKYDGNGVTTAFPFMFKILDLEDLVVTLYDVLGVGTVLTRGVDYTVPTSVVGVDTGGTITLVTPPASDEQLLIKRSVDLVQPVDFQNQGRFFPETHERAFDRLLMQVQDVDEKLGRTIRFNEQNDPFPVIEDSAQSRLGRFLTFDADGNPILSNTAVDPSLYYTRYSRREHVIVSGEEMNPVIACDDYAPGFSPIDVYVNGIWQSASAFQATTGNSVTLLTSGGPGLTIGDLVTVVVGNVGSIVDSAAEDRAAAEAARVGAEDARDDTQGFRDEAATSAAAAAASAAQTGLDVIAADASKNAAAVSAIDAAGFAAQSAAARDAALLSRGVFPTTAAGIGQGVAGVASLVGGSVGTDGTFPLAFAGGTQVIAPQGRFVVAGGTVAQVIIDYPGYYSAGTPTLSFSASSGLTGASATAVMGPNTPVGAYFSIPATSPGYSQLYRVDAGPAATAVGSPYPSLLTVEQIRHDIGGADIRNLLDEPDSLYADPNLLKLADYGVTLSRETYNGRTALLCTPNGSSNIITIPWMPISAFRAAGKISVAVEILQADSSVAVDANRFLAIRQTDGSATTPTLQTDSITLPATAISTPTWFRIENIAVLVGADRVELRLRRNDATMRLGRIVVTASDNARETAITPTDYSPAGGLDIGLTAPRRHYLDYCDNGLSPYAGSVKLTATGMQIGSSGSNAAAGAFNAYMVRTDGRFVADQVCEVIVTATRIDSAATRLLLAVGPSGRNNLSRNIYTLLTDGTVQSWPGNFTGSTTLVVAGSGTAVALSESVRVRLRRNADGTGVIGVTNALGVEVTANIASVPLGDVWIGARSGSSGVRYAFEYTRLQYQRIPVLTTANTEARMVALEDRAGITAPILLNYRLLPDSVASRTPKGFTCTGLDRITRGAYAGCWLAGDDGRLVELDASPYIPAVHVLTPDFATILQTFPMPYTGASVQGVAVDTSGSEDTFWVSCATNDTIRHFDLYGVNAGVEIAGDRVNWSALGLPNQPNGLAYDSTNDALRASPQDDPSVSGTRCYLIACDPAAPSRVISSVTLPSNDPDHLQYDAARQFIYYSRGANGTNGSVNYYKLSNGASGALYASLQHAQAIEGMFIDRATGRLTILNDGGYHSAEPRLNIAITYAVPLLE